MKMKNIAICLAAGLLIGGSGLALKLNEERKMSETKAEAVETFSADLRGGARMTYTAATGSNDGYAWVNQSMMNQASSGSGIYVRMRNYTGNTTPIVVQVYDDSDIGGEGGCWTIPTSGLKYYTYDNQGENEIEYTYLYNTMIQLQPFFDGIVYLPFANYTHNAWGVARESMNTARIWKLQYGLQPLYNSFANYSIGDAFTAEHLNFDSSELTTPALFTTYFTTENYSGDGGITATQELFTDFDPVGKDLNGGEMIKTTTAESNAGPVADICPSEKGIMYSYGFYVRVRNYTGDVWPLLQVMGCEGSNCMPKNGKPFFYYDVDGVFLQKYNASEYNTFYIPAHFDGFIFVPVSSLYNSVPAKPDRYDWLWGIFVTVDALSFPNSVVVFGDVFQGACTRTTGDDANAFVFGRDTNKSSHSSFSSLRNTNSYGKVCHYPGFTDDGATEWAEYFLTETYPCTTAAAGAWSDVGGEFNSLAAADKEILVEAVYAGLTDSQKNSVEKAVERYDLAVKNQGLTNFMSRTPLTGTNKVNLINTNNTTIIIVVACSIMAISAALFLVIRLKRKEN